MSALVSQTTKMLELLPEDSLFLVNALVKKLITAWDPDFTKVTSDEKKLLNKSIEQIDHGDFLSEEDFWDDIV